MKRIHAPRHLDLVFAFVVFLGLVAGGSQRALANESPPLRVAGGLYTASGGGGGASGASGGSESDELTWHARWILAPDATQRVLDGEITEIRFAIPMPAGEKLGFAPGVEAVMENDRLVAVRVTRPGLDGDERAIGRTVRAEIVQPLAHDARGPFVLGAPVAAGTALQIIDGTLDANRRFEVVTGGSLEPHVGHVSPHAVSHDAREHARALTGYESHLGGGAIFVRGDDVQPIGGVRAAITDQREVSHRGAMVIAALFALVVGKLVVVLVRLRRAAGIERADAILAAEIEGS